MHFYSWRIKSYAAATAHLSNEEDLAYRRLLDLYYDTETPITQNNPALSRRLRVAIDVMQSVLEEFFVSTENGWTHTYADREITEYRAHINKQSTNGKLGGRPKTTHSLAKPNPNKPTALPKEPSAKPISNQELGISNNKKENTNTKEVAALLFELGVDDQLSLDWRKLRKERRAPITVTAINGIARQAAKAGISVHDAIATCCERGWTGFKADWVAEDKALRDITAEVASFCSDDHF